MYALRFAVMAHGCVQLRKQCRQFQSFWIERAPDTTQVVGDVFAETDGKRAVVFVEVAGLDEIVAEGDDGAGCPGLLDFAGGPEEVEEPLFWRLVKGKGQ